MNISELFHLTQWVVKEISGKRIVELHTQLHAIVQQNAQGQARQPFETQLNTLVDVLKDVPLLAITNEQNEMLEKLQIARHVGKAGVKNLRNILSTHAADIATIATKLQQIINELTTGIERAKAIGKNLIGLVTAETDIPVDGALFRVTFEDGAAIEDVKQLKDRADDWHTIARGITMIHDKAPEDVRIVGADRGSVIVSMVSTYAVVKTMSLIILEAMKLSERYLTLRLLAEQMKGLKLQNEITERAIAQADAEREQHVEVIVGKVLETLGRKKPAGDKMIALTKAVENVVEFTTSGGSVDFVEPAKGANVVEADQAELEKLASTINEVRALESKIKQLGHKKDIDE